MWDAVSLRGCKCKRERERSYPHFNNPANKESFPIFASYFDSFSESELVIVSYLSEQ